MNKKIILLALSLLVLSLIVGASTLAFADFGTSKDSHNATVVTPDAPNAQLSTSTTEKEEAEPETNAGNNEVSPTPPENNEKPEPEVTPDETPDVTPDETPDVTPEPDEKPEVTPDPDEKPEVTPDPENGKYPVINTPGAPSLDTDETEKPEPEPTPEPEIDYAEKLVSIVKGEVGTKEKKYNNVKYNTWYYGRVVSASSSERPTYAWCITFISWCADRAGISTDVIPKMNNAETLRKYYVNEGLYHSKKDYTPTVGDIIFYGGKTSNHAGVVVAVNANSVTVVEGNASDMVKTITYKLTSSSIMGYAKPNY